MSNTTKIALEASLKKLMLQKPFDKITINDLTKDCGISRMTFYNHFKDIYDLVEWSCEEDGKQALQNNNTYDTWQEGLYQIFQAVLANKPFILNVYRTVSREQIENYLFGLTRDLIENVVEEKSVGREISLEDKLFIAGFYKYSFVGIMLDWIKQGMKEEPQILVEKISLTVRGNIANSVRNFEIARKEHKIE
ncbi:TetR/AcrR family transcriptional regulator [Roseburia sp. MSJ-14]|uniref:TetR/AcrR family transcriptional regulator n=1 Tax=Roseburia sp. MSJ-14 TaxID=2841514 RepID=UPI001C117D88|nr:TetR/AcrR family transcriptional regulator [Roseburia sp. MSJ-14]MBU5473738.1 TetR/AcrR family transcriptional regulator [Roseburia sp. MSJ-14]